MEMIIALAISALLLTATMVALDASFTAYAYAAEEASAQSATRMVSHRLITLVRTGTAHGPLTNDASVSPAVAFANNVATSPYLELLDPNGDILRIEHDSVAQTLNLAINGGTPAPVLTGVTAARFTLLRRRNPLGQWELDRATMDVTVSTFADQNLELENSTVEPIRVIATTSPRKLD